MHRTKATKTTASQRTNNIETNTTPNLQTDATTEGVSPEDKGESGGAAMRGITPPQ